MSDAEETPAVYAHAGVAAVGAAVTPEQPAEPGQDEQKEDDHGMD